MVKVGVQVGGFDKLNRKERSELSALPQVTPAFAEVWA